MRITVLLSSAAFLGLAACSSVSAGSSSDYDGLDRAQLLEDLQVLASDEMQGRQAGTEGNAMARAYIIDRLEDIGIDPVGESFEHPFEYSFRRGPGERLPGVNILAEIEGTGDSDHVMVLTAHFDHEGMRDGQIWNGADDNASGVAALLAVAEDFVANPPEHDLIFAFVDAEERGLQGARAFVANPPVPEANIVFNLNLDMVAMSDDRILWAVGTYHYPFLKPMVERVAERANVNLPMGYDEPGGPPGSDWTMLTDSGAFHAAGIPFIYLGVDFHPHYHQPSDTYENMTLEFFQDATETILDFAREAEANLETIAQESGR